MGRDDRKGYEIKVIIGNVTFNPSNFIKFIEFSISITLLRAPSFFVTDSYLKPV